MRKIIVSYVAGLLGNWLIAGFGTSSGSVSASNVSNPSTTATSSTTTNTSAPLYARQHEVQNQNQRTHSTNTLQMYGAGTLTSDHAVPWPGFQKNPNEYSSTVPVIHVPFTAAITTPTLPAPKTISTSLPPQLSSKLVAYFVQMSATNSFYVLGPPMMTGQALAAADGSFEVYLHNSHASIELDTSGGSPLVADAMAAPFFATARAATSRDVPSSDIGPLAPATVIHPNTDTVYFAFSTKSGRNVSGWNDYFPQSDMGTARMIYKSDLHDWSYAPYVLQATVNLLNNVFAPQIGRTIEQPRAATANVGGKRISIPNSDGRVVQTPRGLAWIWRPPVSVEGSLQSPWSLVPIAPYGLAFAVPHKGKIVPHSVHLMQTIPSVRVVDGDNHVFYSYPNVSSITGNRWLLYTVTWSAPGLNQPYGNDLHVNDTQSGHDTTLTSFVDAGGMFFSLGTSGQYLAYDTGGIRDAKGDLVHSVCLVNLATGKKAKLPTSDLIKSNTTSGESVQVTIGSKTLTIPFNQW